MRRYLIGVADLRMAERMAGVLQANGAERALIVHGGDGLDELTTTGPVHGRGAARRRRHARGRSTRPTSACRRVDREDLVGGDATVNADLARRVLAGEHGPHRDIVSLNAGAGLLVAGPGRRPARRHRGGPGGHRLGRRGAAPWPRLVEVSQREAAAEQAGQTG